MGFLVMGLVYMVWLFAKVNLFKNFITAPIKNIFTICVTNKPIIKSFIIKLNLNAYMVVFTNAIPYEQKPQHFIHKITDQTLHTSKLQSNLLIKYH